MNRNHLMIFAAVAEAGGFSRGAEKLAISQPAVSQQVGELENALGIKLFDRLPRGVRLTRYGEVLLGYARRMAGLEEEAQRALEQIQGVRRGWLTVGASQTIGVYLMPEVLGRYRARHPEIELDLEIGNTEEIQQKLADDRLDLALTEGFVEHEELDVTVFREDELVPIAPPGHAILKQGRVTPRQLCAQPLIFREHGSGTRAVVERALAAKGIEVRPVMSLGSTEAIKRAVAAGIGLAIVSRLAIAQELSARTLIEIPVEGLKVRRPLHRLELRGKSRSPAAEAFVELLEQKRNPGSESRV